MAVIAPVPVASTAFVTMVWWLIGVGIVVIGGSWLVRALVKLWRGGARCGRRVVSAIVVAMVLLGGGVVYAGTVRPKPDIVVIPCDPGCQACRDAGWPDSICMWLRHGRAAMNRSR